MCVPPDALTVVDPSLCDMNDIFFDSLPDQTETEREYIFFDRLYHLSVRFHLSVLFLN